MFIAESLMGGRDPLEVALLTVVILAGLFVVLVIGYLPGLIAARRGHANATAIRVCGFLGLLIWPCWIVALVWAYTGPDRSAAADEPDRSALPDEPDYHLGLHEPPRSRSDSAPPPMLTCDGCGGPLTLSQARQVGARLFCPECTVLLDAGPRAAPADPADEPPCHVDFHEPPAETELPTASQSLTRAQRRARGAG
jgi:hypothetical protein